MEATSNAPRFVVLAAIDGSPATDLVVASAARMARMITGGELHLVYGIDRLAEAQRSVVGGGLVDVDIARRMILDEAVKAAAAAGVPGVSMHVVDDEATRAILQTASELRADLLLVGTHGRTGFSRIMMGSVSEAIVRTARCPVLVVRDTSYAVAGVPAIEPPCPACEEARRTTDGKTKWCARHAEHHPRAHLHYEFSEPFAAGSMLIRP
jgi:nucleotide-binding universal stress UspA family protein